MINKVIIVEGSEDLTFIEWLIIKVFGCIPDNLKIVEVNGKTFFKDYINKIINRVYDKRNDIDYNEEDVKSILLIKDFDLGDDIQEYKLEETELESQHGVNFYKHYICGTEPAPRILERLFIDNDGELLREFVKCIKDFNQARLDANKDALKNANDKFLFHEFFRFNKQDSKLNKEFFDGIASSSNFLQSEDIKNLIEKIKQFIEE